MTTIFRQEFDRKGPVVSFLFLEFLEEGMAALADNAALADQVDVVYAVMEKLGWPEQGRDVALAVLGRLRAPADKPETADEPQEPVRNGVVVSEYLAGLKPVEMCFLLANYDPVQARTLYCDEDFATVAAAAQSKMRRLMVDYYAAQEAAAIAFGGLPDEEGAPENPAPAKKPAAKLTDAGAIKVATSSVDDMNARLAAMFAHRIKKD